ncbi:hypothetical protein ACFU7Y_13135 [Kitasatospora sp. NPDC057542]|uniref:hypothetical protein n=1 Tax=Kitasatospora sp. NPDC057542 TaxID=3346162 RepID=UPI0036A77C0C
MSVRRYLLSSTPAARRGLGLGPGARNALHRPPGRQQPPWTRPAPAPDPPARPQPPQATHPAAVDAIAAPRHLTPAAVLESALHLAQALLERPIEDPLLLEAAAGVTAGIPQYLAAARTPPPTPSTPPTRPVRAGGFRRRFLLRWRGW